ncbi:MAG: hypothetical protein IPL18_01930 [Sphingomonadales bacterium]|nr:hypothetical protein [Sphingomonadales bacterium]
MELISQISAAPFWMILGALLLYLARQLFEGRLKSEFTRMEKLVDSSLGVKTGLREREQDALIEFRLAVETWEYFLQSGIGDLSMKSELGTFEPADFHEADSKAYGAVRMAAVKASVLLRSRALEVELLQTIGAIRQLYYPLVQKAIFETVALQEKIAPYAMRMTPFEQSGMKDLSVALTADDAAKMSELRHAMTAALANYCSALVANYQPIAEQLYALKENINVHVYRPLDTHRIDEPVASLDTEQQGMKR